MNNTRACPDSDCGFDNPTDVKFCGGCGRRIDMPIDSLPEAQPEIDSQQARQTTENKQVARKSGINQMSWGIRLFLVGMFFGPAINLIQGKEIHLELPLIFCGMGLALIAFGYIKMKGWSD